LHKTWIIEVGEGLAAVKYAIVFVEGLADFPVEDLDNQTPLERAVTPAMDGLVADGVVGSVDLFRRVPQAGLEAALYSLLGGNFDQAIPGLGAFEAFAAGLPGGVERSRVAAARLVTQFNGRISDLDGGCLRDKEGELLLMALNEKLGGPGFELVHLCSNQALLLLGEESGALPQCTPPELCIGEPIVNHLPCGPGGDRLAALVLASMEILDADAVNRVRCDLKENPANLLWVWGVGDVPLGTHLLGTRNQKGAMVTQDLWASGMAMAFGLDPVGQKRGVVGDLEEVGQEAAAAVGTFDFVIAHCRGPARAGLRFNSREKVGFIEEVDRLVVAPVRDRLEGEESRLAVISAFINSSVEGTILTGYNPFVLWGKGAEGGLPGRAFTEAESRNSRLEVSCGSQFREYFFSPR